MNALTFIYAGILCEVQLALYYFALLAIYLATHKKQVRP